MGLGVLMETQMDQMILWLEQRIAFLIEQKDPVRYELYYALRAAEGIKNGTLEVNA